MHMHKTWNLVSGDSQTLYPSWAQVKNYLIEYSVGEEKNTFFFFFGSLVGALQIRLIKERLTIETEFFLTHTLCIQTRELSDE